MKNPIAITTGEPAGIGPDITLMALQQSFSSPCVVLGDRDLLEERAHTLNIRVEFKEYNEKINHCQPHQARQLWVWHFPLQKKIQPGQPNAANASYVLEMLKQSTQACLTNKFHALVTAPVNKKIINDAGIAFTGHTEYLADLSHTKKTVMLLMSTQMKVALLTTHIPLSHVAKAVTANALEQCIQIIEHDFKKRFNLPHPKILVCGLNPHAGEGGYLGDEEQKIIAPTIEKLQRQGMQVFGPISADTAFIRENLNSCDVILALYHDQGLPVIKYQGFEEAVNVTLGLPFIRTSVDHGTAEHLAATGKANPSSLIAAMRLAEKLQQDA